MHCSIKYISCFITTYLIQSYKKVMFLWFSIIQMKWIFVQSILGGKDVNITDAPYQVNYVDKCGAVLIHKMWALTTAHCGVDGTYIRIGSKYRLRSPKVRVHSHIVHPQYQREHEFDYDVQLLRFFRPLHFNKWVRAIQICDGGCEGTLQVFGWGYSTEKGNMHDTLRGIEIEMVPSEDCQEVKEFWYNNTLTSRMFCAGGTGKDACQGVEQRNSLGRRNELRGRQWRCSSVFRPAHWSVFIWVWMWKEPPWSLHQTKL